MFSIFLFCVSLFIVFARAALHLANMGGIKLIYGRKLVLVLYFVFKFIVAHEIDVCI